MAIEKKWFTVVNSECFKDAISIKEATVKYGDLGIFFLNEFSIEKYFH